VIAMHSFTNYYYRFTGGDVGLSKMKDGEYSGWMEDDASDSVGVRIVCILNCS
jgi:hypothetical protein